MKTKILKRKTVINVKFNYLLVRREIIECEQLGKPRAPRGGRAGPAGPWRRPSARRWGPRSAKRWSGADIWPAGPRPRRDWRAAGGTARPHCNAKWSRTTPLRGDTKEKGVDQPGTDLDVSAPLHAPARADGAARVANQVNHLDGRRDGDGQRTASAANGEALTCKSWSSGSAINWATADNGRRTVFMTCVQPNGGRHCGHGATASGVLRGRGRGRRRLAGRRRRSTSLFWCADTKSRRPCCVAASRCSYWPPAHHQSQTVSVRQQQQVALPWLTWRYSSRWA